MGSLESLSKEFAILVFNCNSICVEVGVWSDLLKSRCKVKIFDLKYK